jgi:hypothetical protein
VAADTRDPAVPLTEERAEELVLGLRSRANNYASTARKLRNHLKVMEAWLKRHRAHKRQQRHATPEEPSPVAEGDMPGTDT